MKAAASTGGADPAALQAPELRPMRFDDYERIRALLFNHALGCPPVEEWSHRRIDNPVWLRLGSDAPLGWVLETPAGEIVGSMETIPTLYKFRGGDLVAGASAAWCVEASYRGYALQLIDEYFNQSADLFISTTVGAAGMATLNQFYGPIPLGRWDTMSFFITDHVRFAQRVLRKYRVPFASLLAYPTGWSLSVKDALYQQKLPERPGSILIEATDTFDDRFEAFWSELVHENPEKLLAERSRRVLLWHFDAAIRTNQLWIFTASKFGRLRGYCVLRKELRPGVRRMWLVDYQNIDTDNDLLPGFLHAALRRCAAERFYVLQNVGIGVPKMQIFDGCAPYRQKLPNAVFFYGVADAALRAELRESRFWDPSLYDGDATL